MPVYKDERRGTYYYSFSRNGHRVRSKDYQNRKDCDRDLAKALLQTKGYGEYTFNQLAQEFLDEKKTRMKEASWKRFEIMLNHWLVTLGSVRIDKLTPKQYATALEHLDTYTKHGKPLTNRYKNKCIWAFKRLCKWAENRYDITTTVPNKFDGYKNEDKKEMQFLTLEQFQDLLAVTDEEPYRTLFIVLFNMGLRIGEANALTWQDIDFEKGTMTINKTVTTKVKTGDKQYRISTPKTASSIRTLPLPQVVSNALLELRDKQVAYKVSPATAFVFGGKSPLPESTLTKKKDDHLERAGLPRVRLHDFRHSNASLLINNGATPLHVSKWLGHSNVTMTLNTYSHLWKSELNTIARFIDDLQGQKSETVRKNVRKNLVA